MASKNPPVKNAAWETDIFLFAQADNEIKTTPTIAAGDFLVSTDNSATSNLDTTPSESPASSGIVRVQLSADEMNGDKVTVRWLDASGAEWWSGGMSINTIASGQQFDDLSTFDASTDTVDVGAISGDSTAANNAESFFDGTGYAGTNNVIPTVTAVSNQVTADVTAISGDAAAANNAESFFDGTGYAGTNNVIPTVTTLTGHTPQTGDSYARLGAPAGASVSADIADIDTEVDEIHAQIDAIAVTGSALNQVAESSTLAVGTETAGTYESTQASDNAMHVLTAAASEIDIYYQFDIGASGVPVSVSIEGYLKETVPAGGDTVDLFAYDWVGDAWEPIHVAVFTGITTDGPDQITLHTLFARHVGSGANDGVVRVRFWSNSLEANTTLNIDQIYISYAESIAGDITAILADTNELQADWTDGGRLDLLIDLILDDTSELQTDDVPGLIAALNDPDVAAIWAGITSTAANVIADAILSRDVANVEDTASTNSLAEKILATFESVIDTNTGAWTIYKTDHSTTFNTRTATLSNGAITEVT